MNDKSYGILCAFLLGLGQMFLYTGFDTHSFIVEPVLHSVHDRSSWKIDAHAGYYGAALNCVVYTLANLVAPWFLGILGSKINVTLVFSSVTFTLYLSSFFFVHFIPFYLTSAIMGLGFACYFAGNGGYITEHSTRHTIERNSALSYGVGSSAMVVGGIVMLFTITPPPSLVIASSTNNFDSNDSDGTARSYREYSDFEIRMTFGAFALAGFCSAITFSLLPSRPVENSLVEMARNKKGRVGFLEQLRKMGSALSERRMIQMSPVFSLLGSTTSFWIVVYPTTLIFTKKLSGYFYLPAYYSIVVGGGGMIMGLIISYLSKRIKNFGQKPTMVLGVIFHFTALLLVLLSTPSRSANTPNDDATLLLEPSMPLTILIGTLFGMSDNCLSTSRNILAAIVLPEKRSQVFSISKFYQSLTSASLMFLSPFLSIPMYFVFLTVSLTLSLFCFFTVASKTRINERKATSAAHLSEESTDNTDKGQIIDILSINEKSSRENR